MNVNNMYIKDPTIREAILKVKMYRIFSLIFFIVGFFVFLLLYSGYMKGRELVEAFTLVMLGIILLPFTPALVLSWLTLRCDKTAEAALSQYIQQEQFKKEEQARLNDKRMREADAARAAVGHSDVRQRRAAAAAMERIAAPIRPVVWWFCGNDEPGLVSPPDVPRCACARSRADVAVWQRNVRPADDLFAAAPGFRAAAAE